MNNRFHMLRAAALLLLGACATTSMAASPADLRKDLEVAARAATPGFSGLSAARGEQFFKKTHGREWSCATCHGTHPVTEGKHAVTGKIIAPLAPAPGSSRFTDPAKAEKWFKRNCNDVLGRECTASEKGDVLEYLLALNKG